MPIVIYKYTWVFPWLLLTLALLDFLPFPLIIIFFTVIYLYIRDCTSNLQSQREKSLHTERVRICGIRESDLVPAESFMRSSESVSDSGRSHRVARELVES